MLGEHDAPVADAPAVEHAAAPEPAVEEPVEIAREPAAVPQDPSPPLIEPALIEPPLIEPPPLEPPTRDSAPSTEELEPPSSSAGAPLFVEPPPVASAAAAEAPPAAPPAGRTRGVRSHIPHRRGGGRSPLARLAAIVALLAAIAAVILLARALLDSRHTKAVAPLAVVKVLIPEGKPRAQIAQVAAANGLTGSYQAASRRSPLLSPSHYGAPHSTATLEGFLFPATYEMNAHAPASRLVEEQLAAFRENFGATEIARARVLHVTPYQLLTVASMIEREAQLPGDRPKIAAVVYNRLHAGMPLGIDATIYYAVEQRAGIATYTHELTEAQLHIDSPYNTRTHKGLPPTPISNPGVASIRAAAYPAHVSYLYYVAGADGCGEQVFSNTLAEFEANDAAYQAAVKKNGGHPPSCKKK